jgi:hypothetical protein
MQTVVQNFRVFAHEHDDVPAFHAAFLVGTFLAAAVFNVGFGFLLVTIHMMLDYVKYRDFHMYSFADSLCASVLESLADIAILLVALTASVFLHHTFAVVFVSGVLRSGLTLAEAAVTIIPKMEVVERFLAMMLHFGAYMHASDIDLKKPLMKTHGFSLLTIATCFIFLLIAIPLYSGHEHELVNVLSRELFLKL